MTDGHQPGCRAFFWPQSREILGTEASTWGLQSRDHREAPPGPLATLLFIKAFKKCASTYLLLESEDFQAADCQESLQMAGSTEDPHETLAGDL